jgi:hypothetical protein
MSNTTKLVISFVVGLLVGFFVYALLHPAVITQTTAGASPTGSTFTTAKFAAVTINLANTGQNGTSTSIINTDTNSRYVSSVKVGCTGVGTSLTAGNGTGLASLQLSIGTTSTSNPVSFVSGNPVVSGMVIATTTSNYFISSSTSGLTNGSIWGAGMPMTFSWNATNTAVCTEGVEYIGS